MQKTNNIPLVIQAARCFFYKRTYDNQVIAKHQSSIYFDLTYLCLASHKRGNGKQCRLRSERVGSGSTLFALNTGFSTIKDKLKPK